MTAPRAERGQALVLVVGLLLAVVVATLAVGAVAAALTARADDQQAADLAALSAARAMGEAYPRVFGPLGAGAVGPGAGAGALTVAAYTGLARDAAEATAHRNGARDVEVRFPDARDALAPLRVEVVVRGEVEGPAGRVATRARAEAELVPGATGAEPPPGEGEYPGPYATRQGQRMRPDVALAFDRLAAAAQADGHTLTITSAFRSDAEQAVLFARHPDPTWVARPGTSRHRLGTELDLGPASAYGWLAANATRFHFVQRYAWEAWHYGFNLNAASRPTATAAAGGRGGASAERSTGGLPAFVPGRFAPMINGAAQRWNVAGALLAAQLYAESGFDPRAVSGAGAQGIAQFMPATAAGVGLADPFDPAAAIDAQGHLMRDLLRQVGAVDLALAAYNAGPAPVLACGCVPAYPETQRYVAQILALMRGAGVGVTGGELEVRLVA